MLMLLTFVLLHQESTLPRNEQRSLNRNRRNFVESLGLKESHPLPTKLRLFRFCSIYERLRCWSRHKLNEITTPPSRPTVEEGVGEPQKAGITVWAKRKREL